MVWHRLYSCFVLSEPFPEYGIVIIVLGSIILIVLVAAFFIYRFVTFQHIESCEHISSPISWLNPYAEIYEVSHIATSFPMSFPFTYIAIVSSSAISLYTLCWNVMCICVLNYQPLAKNVFMWDDFMVCDHFSASISNCFLSVCLPITVSNTWKHVKLVWLEWPREDYRFE